MVIMAEVSVFEISLVSEAEAMLKFTAPQHPGSATDDLMMTHDALVLLAKLT
jgi:hypothetical protein